MGSRSKWEDMMGQLKYLAGMDNAPSDSDNIDTTDTPKQPMIKPKEADAPATSNKLLDAIINKQTGD